jgi:ATP-dependent protease HslVU (ClpYQ) peptidase subunit
MTCIAAFAKGGSVYMAADSAATDMDTHDQVTLTHPKVFERFGMLFGVTGTIRQQNVMRYFEPDMAWSPREDVMEHLANNVVPSIEEAFDIARIMAGDARPGRMLVGAKGRLFEIDDLFGVSESDVPFAAVGTGAPYALGAMHALWTQALPGMQEDFIVLKGVEAALRFNGSCRGPITLVVR